MMYPLYELEQLEKWLETKIQTLEASGGNPVEYTEVNLTKSILKFVKFMVINQKETQLDHSVSLYQYGMQVPRPTVRYGDNTTSDTICPTCKAQCATSTHCVHRAVSTIKQS